MRQTLLAWLVGLALGAGGVWGYQQFWGNHPALTQARTDLQISRQTLDQQEKKAGQLQQEVTTLKQEHEKLLAKLQQMETSAPAPAEPSTAPAAPDRMASILDATMKRMKGDKLLALKARLKLRPDQETRLKAFLEEESIQQREMAAKMMKGEKFDATAFAQANSQKKTLDQELANVLDPDQKKEYEAMKVDEKKSQLETIANYEMSRSAPILGLNEKQKDDFYNAIYHVQEDMQSPEGRKKYEAPGTPASTDPTHYLQVQIQAKKDAVKEILTPAQFDTYSKQLDSEYELQKGMMQKFMPPTKTP